MDGGERTKKKGFGLRFKRGDDVNGHVPAAVQSPDPLVQDDISHRRDDTTHDSSTPTRAPQTLRLKPSFDRVERRRKHCRGGARNPTDCQRGQRRRATAATARGVRGAHELLKHEKLNG